MPALGHTVIPTNKEAFRSMFAVGKLFKKLEIIGIRTHIDYDMWVMSREIWLVIRRQDV